MEEMGEKTISEGLLISVERNCMSSKYNSAEQAYKSGTNEPKHFWVVGVKGVEPS